MIEARRNDKDTYRLMRGGETLAHARRLNTGRWGVFHPVSGCRLIRTTFERPREACAALDAIFLPCVIAYQECY